MTQNLHVLSAHVLNFLGRWTSRAVPSSKFTKFVTPDRFGIADASLSHFVSHVDIVRFTCRHVGRNLRRNHSSYLCPRIRSAQFTKWTQFFFFQRSGGWSRLAQPGARPCQGALRRLKSVDGLSSGSHVRKTKTPFSACSGMRPCTPVMGLSHRCDTGTRVCKYEGSTSAEDHDVAFVNHS